ncbi:uncharacterized protein [Leuresthes tenuis]|uniref:uncharacterized protein n=1 Tax=Leuresthes tenuis TaxID=355514 RepID=UPI003B50B572
MEVFKLSYILLLPLSATFLDSEVTLVKTIGKEPDVTPLCTNETQTIITMIVCKIRTEGSWREGCRLLYRYGHDFVHECGSRFTLMTENQTVFLHLNDLTPADSGNYTCECSNLDRTFILHLNITVEEDEDINYSTVLAIPCAVTGVCVLIVVILGFLRRRLCRRDSDIWISEAYALSEHEAHASVDEDTSYDDTYESLQHETDDVYETTSYSNCQRGTKSAGSTVAVNLKNEEDDPSWEIYENI